MSCRHQIFPGVGCAQDKWPALSAKVVALPVGETTMLRLVPPCSGGAVVAISVTPLDACHCLVRRVRMLQSAVEHNRRRHCHGPDDA